MINEGLLWEGTSILLEMEVGGIFLEEAAVRWEKTHIYHDWPNKRNTRDPSA